MYGCGSKVTNTDLSLAYGGVDMLALLESSMETESDRKPGGRALGLVRATEFVTGRVSPWWWLPQM